MVLFSLLLISGYGISFSFACSPSSFDGASNAYAACDEPLTLNPVTRQQAPSSIPLNNFGDPIPLTTTHGDSVAIFDNLVYGNTYLFSTCDLNGDSPFDSVIIIRSPTGAVLAGNDDCNSTRTCTVTSYTHNSIAFGSIRVSVYKKTYDREQGTFLCSTASSGSKGLANFFAVLPGSPSVTSCDFKLTCNPTLTVNQLSGFTSSNLIDSGNSDLCGVSNSGITFVDESDGYTTTFFYNDCDYGTRNFSISIYGETCETAVTFIPINPYVGCDSYTTYALPNHLTTTCSFGYPCAIDTSDFRPDIYVYNTCGSSKRSIDGYTVDFDPDDVYASIGDTVYYDVSVLTDEEGYGSTSCSVEFLGIVPEALYSFEIAPNGVAYYPYEPQYIFNDDAIYYDTIYRMEFYFDFGYYGSPPVKRGLDPFDFFGIYLYNPAGFLGDAYNDKVYAQIDIAEFDYPFCGFGKRDVGDCDHCCYSVVDFCIPSTVSERDVGDFQSGNMYRILIASPFYGGFGPTPNKRSPGTPFDSYFISLGNPYVTLSVDPRRENTTPGCAAFNSRVSGFNNFPG